MSMTKIDAIYLYTDFQWDSNEVTESTEAKKFLDDNGIQYTLLNYAIKEDHENCLAPLRSWAFSNIEGGTHSFEKFPFVIYTEVHDDLPIDQMPRVLLFGIDAIKESNIVELYQLGR